MYWADLPEHPKATAADTNKYLESFEQQYVKASTSPKGAPGASDSLRMRRFSRIFVSIALKYFYRNSFDAAIKWFQLAEGSFSGDAQFHALLASCYIMTRQNSDAIAHLRTVVDHLDPKDARSCYNLGCLYSLQSDTADAIGYLSMAIKLDPGYKAKMSSDADFDNIRSTSQFAALQNAKSGSDSATASGSGLE
jgi:tetratricopeptide (TPR) repeat protein